MSTLASKKVSVVVPNYNYAKFLRKRIETIAQQTYPIYELIILDDASTDDSKKEIEKIIEWVKIERPEIKVKSVANEKNSGKAIKQWKKGVELATGDFIWIAEADDVAKKNFLAEAMKGFLDSEVMISYTESKIINGVGLVIAPNFRWSRDKEKTGHYKKSYIKNGREEISEILAIRCTVPNVSAVVFRNDKKLVKYLSEAEKFTQVGDWWLYAKILENGKISYSKKALNLFRVHSKSVTGKAKNGRAHYEEIKMMHDEFREKYQLSREVEEAMRRELERVRTRSE